MNNENQKFTPKVKVQNEGSNSEELEEPKESFLQIVRAPKSVSTLNLLLLGHLKFGKFLGKKFLGKISDTPSKINGDFGQLYRL